MPQRTNPFQTLVTMIERALAPVGAKVQESEDLIDGTTGEPREVNVTIRFKIGEHEVILGVECTAGARPADVQWVEQLVQKHSSLPTNKLILVSKSGFTRTAERKSRALGAEPYSLVDAETADWPAVIKKLASIEIRSILLPFPKAVTVILDATEQHLVDGNDLTLEDAVLTVQDSPPTRVADLVNKWLRDPAAIELFQSKGFENEWTSVRFTRDLKPGVVLVTPSGEELHPIAIQVLATFRVESSTVELTPQQYGDSVLRSGEGRFMDREIRLVVTDGPDSGATVSFHVSGSQEPDS